MSHKNEIDILLLLPNARKSLHAYKSNVLRYDDGCKNNVFIKYIDVRVMCMINWLYITYSLYPVRNIQARSIVGGGPPCYFNFFVCKLKKIFPTPKWGGGGGDSLPPRDATCDVCPKNHGMQ